MSKNTISDVMRKEIVAQALKEVQHARMYKRKKVRQWQENEQLVYQEKPKGVESRANIDLGRGPEFVSTFLSKIDNPLQFEFKKRKLSQAKRVRRLNAIRVRDAEQGYWDLKDIATKKQMITYGRGIMAFFASSPDGVYESCLECIDAYDFLIDPEAGGIDIEKARYLGDQSVQYDKRDLEEMKGDKTYIKSEIEMLLKGNGNAAQQTQEETDKNVRSQIVDGRADRLTTETDVYRFWRWGTTYKGVRYYLLFQETSGACIRCAPVVDLFPATEDFPRGPWWYITYASTIDLTEFWTPSPIQQVKDIFHAQNVTVNQMLDNAEEYNKPMKVVNVSAIENMAELKYRREGVIKTKNNFEADKALQMLRPQPIQTPLLVFEKLEQIQEKASGVTADAKGVSSEERVAIYEGNQENTADRYGLVNKSYAFAYKRLARLFELGVRFNLKKKQAIKIMGPDGASEEEIKASDIFRKNEAFDVLVQASDAEEQLAESAQKKKVGFLMENNQNPVQNQQKAYEIAAMSVGFKEAEIRELMDTTTYADADIMAEADRDLEDLLDGKSIRPNLVANLAYKERFVSYLRDFTENLSKDQFDTITSYLVAIEPIVIKNSMIEVQRKITKMQIEQAAAAQGQAQQPQPAMNPSAQPQAGVQGEAGNSLSSPFK